MPNLTIPFVFSPNTLIQSSQVNSDFTAVANYINSGSGSFAASGYAILPGPMYVQWGAVNSVAADGSAASAPTFPIAFPTACWVVIPSIKNAFQTNPWALTLQFDTPTTTGFNVNVAGGPAAGTVTVNYIAIGN